MPSDCSGGMASAFMPLTRSHRLQFSLPQRRHHPPSVVKERPMMEAMERQDRPVMEEERPMMESVTAPAAPHDVLDRHNGLHCRCAPGRSDQGLGVIWYQDSCRQNRH